MTSPRLTVIVVAVTNALAGFGLGYWTAQRRLELEFERRLEKETAGMREFYQTAKQPFATPQEAAAELIKEEEPKEGPAQTANNKVAYHKIVQKNYKPEESATIDDEVFSARDGMVVEGEIQHSNVFQEAVVIISQEEFMENESGYNQSTLTYYQVDKVLTDERDDVIDDSDAVVGDQNLTMFGSPNSGSSDPNVIHIRNGRLQMEFEVQLNANSYRLEVLGIEEDPPELPSGRKRS